MQNTIEKPKKKRNRKPKHSHAFIKAYFEKLGCTLLTETYTGCKQPLKYRCKCGLITQTNYNNHSRGFHCANCYIQKCQVKVKKRLKKLVLREKLYTMADAAIWLGVHYDEFYTEVKVTKRLPSPTHVMPGKRRPYYKVEDLEKIRDMIE